MTYIAKLAAAHHASNVARSALDKATRQVQPPSNEMHALFMERPEAYSKCLHEMAEIMATLPALRAALVEAEAVLAPLQEMACHRCDGTGRYTGATSATRRGVPYCFKCNGQGTIA